MAYIKSAEEKKWLIWKLKEEEKLRELGVDETVIARLRVSDWEAFNKERSYKQQQIVSTPYLEIQPYVEQEVLALDVQNLLDSVENEQLLKVLMQTDKLTLQILLLKSMDYSTKEIAQTLNITDKTIYCRISRIKKKIKNIF